MSITTFTQDTSNAQWEVGVANAPGTAAAAVTVIIDWAKVSPQEKTLAVAALNQIQNALVVYDAPAS